MCRVKRSIGGVLSHFASLKDRVIFVNELNSAPMFFLGANSPKGFVSAFSNCYSAADGWRAFVIKGGPGTGKSTLMKRVAIHFIKQGVRCHLCPCSSDPYSLDAVIFPDLKAVILDGTAPHVVEPSFPGACEEIVNLGEYWQGETLYENRGDILKLFAENSLCHKRASSYIRAAGSVIEDTAAIAEECTDFEKVHRFALRLAKKTVPKTHSRPKEWVRYLSAVTPVGHVFYKKTPEKLCENKILISDEYGAASPALLGTIREYALENGHEIICCRCPMRPFDKTEHIIIPALSLGFCTVNRYHTLESDERTIHARRFTDVGALHTARARLSFNRKASAQLILKASEALENAKKVHDVLEEKYREAMNFEALDTVKEELIRKIGRI